MLMVGRSSAGTLQWRFAHPFGVRRTPHCASSKYRYVRAVEPQAFAVCDPSKKRGVACLQARKNHVIITTCGDGPRNGRTDCEYAAIDTDFGTSDNTLTGGWQFVEAGIAVRQLFARGDLAAGADYGWRPAVAR